MKVPLAPTEHPNQVLRKLGSPYDPELPLSFAFGLIGLQRGWKPGSKTWKKNWNACMNCEYDRLIGCRVTSLTTWQQLCAKLGIKDSFKSINQCKKLRFSYPSLTSVGPGSCPREHRRPSGFVELRYHPDAISKQGGPCYIHQVNSEVLWTTHRQAR